MVKHRTIGEVRLINVQNKLGFTPLHAAIIHNHDDMCTALVRAGED